MGIGEGVAVGLGRILASFEGVDSSEQLDKSAMTSIIPAPSQIAVDFDIFTSNAMVSEFRGSSSLFICPTVLGSPHRPR